MTAAEIGYLGFASRGNLGDDAIEVALARALPDASFFSLPLYPGDLPAYARAGHLRRGRAARLLLGGGTVIGRKNWRIHLEVATRLIRTKPLQMLGAGVEDPNFQGIHSFSSGSELTRWKALLAQFEQVSVRGPRSAELLADIGVSSTVVGDPALLLQVRQASSTEAGLLGVNLGWGDDLWGHDPAHVQREVASALRHLSGLGWRIKMFIANEADRAYSMECLDLAGCRAEIVTAIDPDVFMDLVAPCDLLLAERLHAGILGVAAGVPTAMLEYQPKCLDFMRSVDSEAYTVRTDVVRGGSLSELLVALKENRAAQAQALRRRVDALRQAQRLQLDAAFRVGDSTSPQAGAA